MKTNRMYFPCCRSKSVSQENLDVDDGNPQGTRRPNPIIVGLANHLREHHSSARNSAIAGCFGIPDSPPKYDDIYTLTGSPRESRINHEGICNVVATKTIMAEEGMSSSDDDDDELPPPSYKESVEMASSYEVDTITIQVTATEHENKT